MPCCLMSTNPNEGMQSHSFLYNMVTLCTISLSMSEQDCLAGKEEVKTQDLTLTP